MAEVVFSMNGDGITTVVEMSAGEGRGEQCSLKEVDHAVILQESEWWDLLRERSRWG